MGKLNDLKGMKFGEWTVLEYAGDSKWLCECSCGKTIKPVKTYYLKSGKSTCCGKCAKIYINKGDKFGEWEVLDSEDYNNGTSRHVYCRCSCGRTEKSVSAYDLIYGKTKRCLKCDMFEFKEGMKFEEWTVLESGIKSNNDKILCSCSCGRSTRKVFVFELLSGGSKMCIKCSAVKQHLENKLTHEQYLNKLKENKIQIEVLEKYNGYDTKIYHKCIICKEPYLVAPANVLNGSLCCNKCSNEKQESIMATILKHVMKKYFPNTVWEYDAGFKGNKGGISKYDIFVPEINLLIECQSEYHDTENKKNIDLKKKQYAVDNNYDFIAIDHRDYSPLQAIQLFFPWIEEVPYLDIKNTRRTWSIKKAQELLDSGYLCKMVAKELGVRDSTIYSAIYDGILNFTRSSKKKNINKINKNIS